MKARTILFFAPAFWFVAALTLWRADHWSDTIEAVVWALSGIASIIVAVKIYRIKGG